MDAENRKRAPIFATIRRALALVRQSGSLSILVINGVWVLLGVSSSVTAVLNKNFLNAAAEVLTGTGGAFRATLFWLAIWAAVELGCALFALTAERKTSRMWYDLELFVEEKVLQKVGGVKMRYFDDREDQKKIRNVKGNFSRKISSVTGAVIQILRTAVTLVSVLLVIGGESWLIALIVCAASVPAIFVSRKNTNEQYWMSQGQSFDEQMQRYLGLVLTKRKYVKEMRFYQLYDYVGDKYDASVLRVLKAKMKLNIRYFFAGTGVSLLNFAALAASLVLISLDILNGRAGIGSFMLIYSTTQTLQSALSELFGALDTIGDSGRYLEDYEEVMAFETEETDAAHASAEAGSESDREKKNARTGEHVRIGNDFGDKNGSALLSEKEVGTLNGLTITFEHVSFSYPGSDREVLKDVNLTIHPHEKIAIVGENGSGKSTFVALLTGLYAPTKGRILVNGQPLDQVLRFLRDNISCTTQEFFHLEGTVADNVLIGDYGHPHTTEEVRDVLAQAGLLEDIDAYEKREQTTLGNLYPGSVDLSGGQWQKLAMARNLIKTDAQLMILDEPTAALDPMAESKLYHDFAQLTQDKAVVLISHRLGATRLADRVLVFDDGRVVEDGSHETLLEKGQLYRKMYAAQAQWYTA